MQEWGKLISKKEFFKIVDILASEYGWTIEYIQSLDLSEINNLLTVIYERKAKEVGKTEEVYQEEEAFEKAKKLGIFS